MCGEGALGERRGRLGEPSSLGVVDRPRSLDGRCYGTAGSLGVVFESGACAGLTLLVHHHKGRARALSCGALHLAPSPWVRAAIWHDTQRHGPTQQHTT